MSAVLRIAVLASQLLAGDSVVAGRWDLVRG
jgi:hypothetical protein